MKTLNSYGQYFIKPNGSSPRGRSLFDPWNAHAAFPFELGIINGISGNFFLYAGTLLKNGTPYFWISASPMTQDAAGALLYDIQTFQVSNYPGDWTGEGFNAIMRKQLQTKILQTDLTIWQAAN